MLLTSIISQRTGIDKMALCCGSSFNTYSIAKRMLWAADHQTTWVKNKAYCLMGIFNVNMPLIYSKGRKAFFWLQEELLRWSDNASIFAYIAFELKFPRPSALCVRQLGNAIWVSEHINLEIYPEMDKELQPGIVGLFSLSPSFFCGVAKFIPHRVLGY